MKQIERRELTRLDRAQFAIAAVSAVLILIGVACGASPWMLLLPAALAAGTAAYVWL